MSLNDAAKSCWFALVWKSFMIKSLDFQTLLFKSGEDRTDVVFGHGAGFNHGKSAFDRHGVLLKSLKLKGLAPAKRCRR